MGLFSFLFGGKKKKAEPPTKLATKPAPRAALHMPAEPVALAAGEIAIDAAPEPARSRGFELTHLKLAYAAHVRAGDAAKAYASACQLAGFYKSVGARGLSAEYRAAADRHFGDWLASVSRDRRRTALVAVQQRAAKAGAKSGLARTRLAVAAEKLGGPEAAKLLVAHRDFLARLDGPRGRAIA
ncbi:MAG: hypothetical protein GC155_11005 [Alphaproteobacteria bacterium]|nr:hypothetical protein [Alphaproteobacteria bacterium]